MSEETPEVRKFAAIMVTDMVGYSALMHEDEAKALALVKVHNDVLRPFFTRHRGREVKTMGDAFLVEFPSAQEALDCALEIQEAVVERNSDTSCTTPFELRIGVHAGEVLCYEGDIFGDNVNIASRIEPLSPRGGVCFTQAVKDLLKERVDRHVVSAGDAKLKNISSPVALYCIDVKHVFNRSWFRLLTTRYRIAKKTARFPKRRVIFAVSLLFFIVPVLTEHWNIPRVVSDRNSRIAVLPFTFVDENRSVAKDSSTDYLADGITDDVITGLSQSDQMKVIAQTSVMPYKDNRKPLSKMSGDLNVAYFVEGTLTRADKRYVLNVRLIDAGTETTLWTTHIEKDLKQAYALHESISSGILDFIKNKKQINSSLRAPASVSGLGIGERGPKNGEAYITLAKGKFFLAKRNSADMLRGYELLQKAVELDPGYAQAYTELAKSLSILSYYEVLPSLDTVVQAQKNLDQAVRLGNANSDTYLTAAQNLAYYQRNWAAAEDSFKKAITLAPANDLAHRWYGHFLVIMRRYKEATAQFQIAQDLDPISLSTQAAVGLPAYYQGHYSEAIRDFKAVLEMDKDFVPALLYLGWAQIMGGQLTEALRTIEHAAQIAPQDSGVKASLAIALARSGEKDKAMKYYKELSDPKITRFISGYTLASVASALELRSDAVQLLDGADKEFAHRLPFLRIDPFFSSLQRDPKVQEIVAKMGLKP